MMKLRKTAVSALKAGLTAAALFYCLTRTAEVREAVSDGVERCIYTVIPSLYAMLILSGLLTGSGLISAIYRRSQILGDLAVFTVSQFAGYPVGARMLAAEAAAGRLPKQRAEALAGACCGAGPAFVFGCISSRLYSSDRAGIVILISTVSANAVLAVWAVFRGRGSPAGASPAAPGEVSAAFTDAVAGGGSAMTGICFMVTAFSVLTAMLHDTGIIGAIAHPISEISGMPEAATARAVCAFLDVTAAERLPAGDVTLLPVIAGLVSFGGVCVLMQIAAVVQGQINIRQFAVSRLAAAVLSFAVCKLITPRLMSGEAVAVSALRPALHAAPSPVPSVLLIIMTLAVLSESGRLCKKPETE